MPDVRDAFPGSEERTSPNGTWQDGNVCLGCGSDNPQGLRLTFAWEGDRMVATWVPRPEHQGWKGFVHGGMLSLVLDEVMAQSVNRSGYLVPTAEITARFKRPAPIGEPLTLSATRPEGKRLLTVRGEARDAEGNLVAEATAKFIPQRHSDPEARP